MVSRAIEHSCITSLTAVTKIGFAKAVIHSIGAEAEGIFKLAGKDYRSVFKIIFFSKYFL